MFWRKKRDETLKELISGLLERQERLERDMKSLLLDWENTYDKLKTMMGRITKRHEAVVRLETEHASEETAPDRGSAGDTASAVGLPTNGSGGRLLTPRQMEIQQAVLRRRGGGGGV